ncbi:CPBP family intramembrane metalloprotease [Kytococcus sedentarius]|uniref:CPBP family intramembrane glutamic endopeptidase n=1 Tax=Kytococcus sedentarius TaxID=1276 RepID=UPI0018E15918|nr:type II CAAX endopeptidase family protein [Kytococcus sedentarius]QQB63679.1 CPBP family intramembrane metalloprotease [Kytococcus sedentarius]
MSQTPTGSRTGRGVAAFVAAGCLVAAVVVGGHPVVGPMVAVVALVVVAHGARRQGGTVTGAGSVAALALCLVAAVWTLRGAGAALEGMGVPGAAGIALWPVPLVLAVGLYVVLSRWRALHLVTDWFRAGTVNRTGAWLTVAIVPVSALALVIWSWAAAEDGAGQNAYRQLAENQGVPVLVLGALAFSAVNAAAEESAYNGVAQRALGLDLRGPVAVVLSAAMFGASHWYGFPNGWWGVCLAGVYGLVLSVLRQVSRGLLLPWVAHVLADLTIVAVLMTLW